MKAGTEIIFYHYGTEKRGTVARVANDLVWLADGRWLHIESVTIPEPFKPTKRAAAAMLADFNRFRTGA